MRTSPLRLLTIARVVAWSEFRLRYAGSALGYVWSLGRPLLLFAVMYAVFTKVLRVGAGIENYPLMLLLAIMLWSFFAEATGGSVTVLVARADLLRKVAFPSIALPLSVVLTASVAMLLNLVAVAVFLLHAGIEPTWSWLWLPLLFVELLLVTTGVSLVLSAMFVQFRDVGQIWEVLAQALFYATPVIYPLSLVPPNLDILGVRAETLVTANPLAQVIEQVRRIVVQGRGGGLGDVLPGPWVFVPYVIAVVVVCVGVLLYRSVAPKMVERL